MRHSSLPLAILLSFCLFSLPSFAEGESAAAEDGGEAEGESCNLTVAKSYDANACVVNALSIKGCIMYSKTILSTAKTQYSSSSAVIGASSSTITSLSDPGNALQLKNMANAEQAKIATASASAQSCASSTSKGFQRNLQAMIAYSQSCPAAMNEAATSSTDPKTGKASAGVSEANKAIVIEAAGEAGAAGTELLADAKKLNTDCKELSSGALEFANKVGDISGVASKIAKDDAAVDGSLQETLGLTSQALGMAATAMAATGGGDSNGAPVDPSTQAANQAAYDKAMSYKAEQEEERAKDEKKEETIVVKSDSNSTPEKPKSDQIISGGGNSEWLQTSSGTGRGMVAAARSPASIEKSERQFKKNPPQNPCDPRFKKEPGLVPSPMKPTEHFAQVSADVAGMCQQQAECESDRSREWAWNSEKAQPHCRVRYQKSLVKNNPMSPLKKRQGSTFNLGSSFFGGGGNQSTSRQRAIESWMYNKNHIDDDSEF